MDEAKIYKTAGAFRTALETRLQMRARAETTDLHACVGKWHSTVSWRACFRKDRRQRIHGF
jgi:hypothetical protein